MLPIRKREIKASYEEIVLNVPPPVAPLTPALLYFVITLKSSCLFIVQKRKVTNKQWFYIQQRF